MRYALLHCLPTDAPAPVSQEDHDQRVGRALLEALVGRPRRAIDMELYSCVALVETADLARLFERTNAIDAGWTRNAVVLWARSDRERSISVGDIAIDTASGEAMVCANLGWEPFRQHGSFHEHLALLDMVRETASRNTAETR